MPSIAWNSSVWGNDYKWPEGGEEWSRRWGGSEAQWFGCLYPRLHRFLPACRILEIAPGYGRWSNFLIPASSGYLGIDLNENCIEACEKRFKHFPHAKFVCNDGMSLSSAEDASYNLIFSFDSLVHAEIDVLYSYVPDIIRKLTRGGVAFIHHSNLAAAKLLDGQHGHGRGKSVSADAIATIINASAGAVMIQEVINWVDTGLIDCMTTFGRRETFGQYSATLIENACFIEEATIINKYQSPYSKLHVTGQ
jgi:SAM-dependent methyltransferase